MRASMAIAGLLMAVAGSAGAETWKGVPIVDTLCLSKVKDNPDAHTRGCAIQCAKGGYGLIASDGAYLKFDAVGNEKALAAFKGSKKDDHLRATVEGERKGDTLAVTSITLE